MHNDKKPIENSDNAPAEFNACEGRALISLYQAAAKNAVNCEARAFFLTQAYIHALEENDRRAAACHKALVALGCEH